MIERLISNQKFNEVNSIFDQIHNRSQINKHNNLWYYLLKEYRLHIQKSLIFLRVCFSNSEFLIENNFWIHFYYVVYVRNLIIYDNDLYTLRSFVKTEYSRNLYFWKDISIKLQTSLPMSKSCYQFLIESSNAFTYFFHLPFENPYVFIHESRYIWNK